MRPLGLGTIEGLVKGFPVKLLLMGFPISEFLALPDIGEDEDLFEAIRDVFFFLAVEEFKIVTDKVKY